MIKKLKSNKGATLTIALMILIGISLIVVTLVLTAGISARNRLNSIKKLNDKIVLENTMYDFLDDCVKEEIDLISINEKRYEYEVEYIKNNETGERITIKYYIDTLYHDNKYSFTISQNKDYLFSEVTFEENSYTISKWGFQ